MQFPSASPARDAPRDRQIALTMNSGAYIKEKPGATSPSEAAPVQSIRATPLRGAGLCLRNGSLTVCALGLLFLELVHRPLWHTDIWGHLSYGRWIWQHGALPCTEPLMPLAAGVPMVDTAWLSQLLGYGLFEQFGPASMQWYYAACITLAVGLLIHAVVRTTGSLLAGFLAAALFLVLDYQQLLVVRPQLVGLVCFAALLSRLASGTPRASDWYLIPLAFVLWANLHGSVIVGLLLLATFGVGHALDIFRRTRRFGPVFADNEVRRLMLLLGLACVATLINPYGVHLYPAILGVARNANVHALIEWQPLTWSMSQGKAATFATLLLIGVWLTSPRRITGTEFLLVGGLGLSALLTSRMILWWAPVVAWTVAVHLAAIWRRWSAAASNPVPSLRWTILAAGWLTGCLLLVPGMQRHRALADASGHAETQLLRRSVASSTPVDLVEYLRSHPPEGQVFNTFEWGDFLLWAGPPGLQVFTASHVHLIPRPVWQDSLVIVRHAPGWQDLLERYGVRTLILNRRRHRALINRLRKAADEWRIDYVDGLSVVIVRNRQGSVHD